MCKQSLISLALISFSIVSNAAAIPMDADQAMFGATQNAVLHKEVALVQGGGFDKDVADAFIDAAVDKCQIDATCTKVDVQNAAVGGMRIYANQSVGDWFVQDRPGTLQSLMVWLIILASVVFFLSRKSASTK